MNNYGNYEGPVNVIQSVMDELMKDDKIAQLCRENESYRQLFLDASTVEARRIMVADARQRKEDKIIPFPAIPSTIS